MWDIYDYLTPSGRNDIAKWAGQFSKERRVKMKVKVDLIRRLGTDVSNEILADIGQGFYKLKVKGKPQLRPLLCRGVVDKNSEFTFLIGAIEDNNDFKPKDAVEQAGKRYAELLENPSQRCEHEEIN